MDPVSFTTDEEVTSPVVVSIFLVLMRKVQIFSRVRSNAPNFGTTTGIAKKKNADIVYLNAILGFRSSKGSGSTSFITRSLQIPPLYAIFSQLL